VTFDHRRGGPITSIEAFVLAVMTAIVVAIAVPSYVTMRDRSNDSEARAQLRQAGDAAVAYRADHGSYEGMTAAALGHQNSELAPSRYRVMSVSNGAYCLETTVRGRTWRLTAPAGDVRRGGC